MKKGILLKYTADCHSRFILILKIKKNLQWSRVKMLLSGLGIEFKNLSINGLNGLDVCTTSSPLLFRFLINYLYSLKIYYEKVGSFLSKTKQPMGINDIFELLDGEYHPVQKKFGPRFYRAPSTQKTGFVSSLNGLELRTQYFLKNKYGYEKKELFKVLFVKIFSNLCTGSFFYKNFWCTPLSLSLLLYSINIFFFYRFLLSVGSIKFFMFFLSLNKIIYFVSNANHSSDLRTRS